MRQNRFDGITHIGGGRVKSDGVQHRVFIAFEPTQVKSAIGNNGNFDATNPDIRLSRAPTTEPASAPVSKTAAERAQVIIDTRVNRSTPVDDVFKFATNNVMHLPQLIDLGLKSAGLALDKGLAMLPQRTQEALRTGAETVKAGVVSDYGVPTDVIDQRALLQGVRESKCGNNARVNVGMRGIAAISEPNFQEFVRSLEVFSL